MPQRDGLDARRLRLPRAAYRDVTDDMASRDGHGGGRVPGRRAAPPVNLPPALAARAGWGLASPSPARGGGSKLQGRGKNYLGDQPYQPTTSAITLVVPAALKMSSLPLAPRRTTTRFGMVCPAMKFKSDVVGCAAPSGNSVR